MSDDSIFIEGLRLLGKHGVHEHERKNEQEFLIDIRAEFDTRDAAASDDLKDTLDYSQFARTAADVVSGNSFYLLERLAATIAERLLEDGRIATVSITIRKLAALQNGVPGITITRDRSDCDQ